KDVHEAGDCLEHLDRNAADRRIRTRHPRSRHRIVAVDERVDRAEQPHEHDGELERLVAGRENVGAAAHPRHAGFGQPDDAREDLVRDPKPLRGPKGRFREHWPFGSSNTNARQTPSRHRFLRNNIRYLLLENKTPRTPTPEPSWQLEAGSWQLAAAGSIALLQFADPDVPPAPEAAGLPSDRAAVNLQRNRPADHGIERVVLG